MKTKNAFVVAVLIGLLGSVFCTSAEAAVRVYRVTFNSKGWLYPKKHPIGSSQSARGYLIVETTDPGQMLNFATITLEPGKIYSSQGNLSLLLWYQVLNPFGAIDRSGNGVLDTFRMFEAGEHDGRHYAGLFRGKIPRNGFRLAGTLFTDEARLMRYQGRAVGLNFDLLRRTGVLRMDPITVTNPQASVPLQVLALKNFLNNKGYTEGF